MNSTAPRGQPNAGTFALLGEFDQIVLLTGKGKGKVKVNASEETRN